tara:strand:+ start:683 stop:895 length:213 start_codon:yes stop_codon:yes gene_type:complete
MRITKLEKVALENIASDIRRSANKLTRTAWDQEKDNAREYQHSKVGNVIYDLEEIIEGLRQMENILGGSI